MSEAATGDVEMGSEMEVSREGGGEALQSHEVEKVEGGEEVEEGERPAAGGWGQG